MSMPLLEGRELDDRDLPCAPMAIVINKSMANRYWPGQSPLGKQFEFSGCRDQPCTIVGVVGDVRHFGPTEGDEPAMYGAHAQKPSADMRNLFLLIRASRSAGPLIAAVK